jgi:membrane protease YdiL (CAAX protease family)
LDGTRHERIKPENFARAARCVLHTGLLVTGWLAASALLYFAFGPGLDGRVEADISVSGCQPQVVENVEAAGFRRDPAVSVGAWTGEVTFERRLPLFEQGAMSSAMADWTDALRSSGCSVTDLQVRQRASWLPRELGWSLFAAGLLLFGAVSLFGLRASGRVPRHSLSRVAVSGVAGVLLAGLFMLVAWVATSLELVPTTAAWLNARTALSATLLLQMVLLLPLAEELVFRRLALQLWVDAGLPRLGVVLVSLPFVSLHLVSHRGGLLIAVAVALLLLSLAAGVAYRRAGLFGAFALHAGYNGALVAPIVAYSGV